jgi:hypothetical protein
VRNSGTNNLEDHLGSFALYYKRTKEGKKAGLSESVEEGNMKLTGFNVALMSGTGFAISMVLMYVASKSLLGNYRKIKIEDSDKLSAEGRRIMDQKTAK